jgi:hypothetical protein
MADLIPIIVLLPLVVFLLLAFFGNRLSATGTAVLADARIPLLIAN